MKTFAVPTLLLALALSGCTTSSDTDAAGGAILNVNKHAPVENKSSPKLMLPNKAQINAIKGELNHKVELDPSHAGTPTAADAKPGAVEIPGASPKEPNQQIPVPSPKLPANPMPAPSPKPGAEIPPPSP